MGGALKFSLVLVGVWVMLMMLMAPSLAQKHAKSSCECDSILSPIFYFHFLPAFIPCTGNYVCVMMRVKWLHRNEDGQWGFSSKHVSATLEKQNPEWFRRSGLAPEIQVCASDSYHDQKEELELKMTKFLRCLQAALRPTLCGDCIEKYWNVFRFLDHDQLRTALALVALRRGEKKMDVAVKQ